MHITYKDEIAEAECEEDGNECSNRHTDIAPRSEGFLET
jgi:hypothetical protein